MSEALNIIPCWRMKSCRVTKCPAHGKVVNCYGMANAGYLKKFCDGPMCKRLKNMVCPGCAVAAQWKLNELLPSWTEAEIQQRIDDGRLIVERPVDNPDKT